MSRVLDRSPGYVVHPDSVVFHGTTWHMYKALLKNYDEMPSRINFSNGRMELMTLSIEHEHYKGVLGSMVTQVAVAFRIPMAHGGSSTLKRMKFLKGLEADQCYWIAHEPQIRAVKRIDLRTNPPPDLVIEIDVMHAVVNREKIYAALGVPEMWVLRRDHRLEAFRLEAKKWLPIERSVSFPFFAPSMLQPFIDRVGVDDDTSILADFGEFLSSLKTAGA